MIFNITKNCTYDGNESLLYAATCVSWWYSMIVVMMVLFTEDLFSAYDSVSFFY